jgi:hypothetical protein
MPERANTQKNDRPARRIAMRSQADLVDCCKLDQRRSQRASPLAIVVLASNHRFAVIGAYICFPHAPGKGFP